MQSQVMSKASEASADPNRVKRYVAQLDDGAQSFLRQLSAEQARIVAALLAGSQASAELLIAHPDWLPWLLEPGFLTHPRQDQGLRREVGKWLPDFLKRHDYDAALDGLRQFKTREMVRIAARDLARLGAVGDITREISNVADVCLQTAGRVCRARLSARWGEPFHLDADNRWEPTKFCVLGLGKLGGQELNYSSDVDILFVYSEEGHVFKNPPRGREQSGKGMGSHPFFTRLCEAMAGEFEKMTAHGSLFRVDLRLRPEGQTGPLARSLASYENYYAQWGQTWERMMLIKARPVAGDLELGAEFVETIHPFRYPRSLSERTLREVAAIKKRIELEVVKEGELDRNVKLGRGGIREIEFVAQTLQLLHAGEQPFLQSGCTLAALKKLTLYSLLSETDAQNLESAYVFLRDVEHRLQMEAWRQTHTIPIERAARERLARLMGFGVLSEFEAALRQHTREARRIYDQILAGDEPQEADLLPATIEGEEARWKTLLTQHGFREPDRALKMIGLFLHGPGFVHVSTRTTELARELLGQFFALCPPVSAESRVLSDPDRALVRLDSFVDAYGARATLYELWTHNPSLFQLLLLLFDRSEFLAERAIRSPDLIDELETSGRLRRAKDAGQTLKDLRYGALDKDQGLWIRRYQEAEVMRIGLRDILGLSDFEDNLRELSALADACLGYALEMLSRKYKFKEPPFAVIALGKLGGQEINYGSDLDVIFVTDAPAAKLGPLQRLAAEWLEMISAHTEAGTLFRVDVRLRPDGEKGLLVNTLKAHEEYYRRRAALWEIQALTRARAVTGQMNIGVRFLKLAANLTDFSAAPARETLRAYTAEWKKEIDHMRERIAQERTPNGKETLAIKTGAGGLMDAEFLAQAFSLQAGFQEANTLAALKRGAALGLISQSDGNRLVDNYKKLRRIEGILRLWSFQGETVLPDEAAPLHRVAVRCGYAGPGEFMASVGGIRQAIRGVYARYFRPA
jgi:glutamate-ammonia-ligase adenylyltransferase